MFFDGEWKLKESLWKNIFTLIRHGEKHSEYLLYAVGNTVHSTPPYSSEKRQFP